MSDFNIEAFCQDVILPQLLEIKDRLSALEGKASELATFSRSFERLSTLLDVALRAYDTERRNATDIHALRHDFESFRGKVREYLPAVDA